MIFVGSSKHFLNAFLCFLYKKFTFYGSLRKSPLRTLFRVHEILKKSITDLTAN